MKYNFLYKYLIKLTFKIIGETISGIDIDTKTLSVYPNSKFQLQIEKEIISEEFFIWNSFGNCRYCINN